MPACPASAQTRSGSLIDHRAPSTPTRARSSSSGKLDRLIARAARASRSSAMERAYHPNPMNLFELTAPQLAKTLRTIDRWLTLAEQYAETRKFPVDNLIHARLAPGHVTLLNQVQRACDNAHYAPG